MRSRYSYIFPPFKSRRAPAHQSPIVVSSGLSSAASMRSLSNPSAPSMDSHVSCFFLACAAQCNASLDENGTF